MDTSGRCLTKGFRLWALCSGGAECAELKKRLFPLRKPHLDVILVPACCSSSGCCSVRNRGRKGSWCPPTILRQVFVRLMQSLTLWEPPAPLGWPLPAVSFFSVHSVHSGFLSPPQTKDGIQKNLKNEIIKYKFKTSFFDIFVSIPDSGEGTALELEGLGREGPCARGAGGSLQLLLAPGHQAGHSLW